MSIDYSVLALPKGEPRKRAKGRKTRAEAKAKQYVRALCVGRDRGCRIGSQPMTIDARINLGFCDGLLEWAHMHARRRSKTRNQDPAVRHDTKYSLMLCKFHHAEYDSKRLVITALTRKGADGPLRFRRAKCSK